MSWFGRRESERQSAFAAVYGRYRRALYKYAFRIVQSSSDAEDIVHEVFGLFLEKYMYLVAERSEEGVKRFLMVCTRNRAFNLVRRRQTAGQLFGRAKQDLCGSDEPPDEAPPEEILCGEELLEEAFAEVDRLPPIYADVLWLHLQGMSVKKIAELLGIKQNTAGKRLARAKEMLRKAAAEKGWIE